MEGKKYGCERCYRVIELAAGESIVPECCGQPMTEDLAVCTTSDTAEHARFKDAGEPCDDGRAGKG